MSDRLADKIIPHMYIHMVGAVLARPKGPFLHWGVVTERGTVFHNTPERGEHESSLAEFAAGYPVSVKDHITDTFGLLSRLQERRANPRTYDAASWNCEDTAANLAGSWPRTTQFFAVALAVTTVVIAVLVLRKQ